MEEILWNIPFSLVGRQRGCTHSVPVGERYCFPAIFASTIFLSPMGILWDTTLIGRQRGCRHSVAFGERYGLSMIFAIICIIFNPMEILWNTMECRGGPWKNRGAPWISMEELKNCAGDPIFFPFETNPDWFNKFGSECFCRYYCCLVLVLEGKGLESSPCARFYLTDSSSHSVTHYHIKSR